MLEKLLDSMQSDDRILPNKFTIALGKRIRAARLEANMTQADLANKAYFKQSSISKIESGNRAVSAEDILYLCYALNKPINYFFPKEFSEEFSEDDLTLLEKEFLLVIRQLSNKDIKKLIAQAKALIDYKE